jgi:hypothetical protein
MNERSEAQQWMGGVPSREVFASSFGTFSADAAQTQLPRPPADAAPNTTPSSVRRAKLGVVIV